MVRYEEQNAQNAQNEKRKDVKWFPGTCLAKYRDDEIPGGDELKKDIRTRMVKRKFIKESSVFGYYNVDDTFKIKKCMDHDFKYWKCQRFIKSMEDYKGLCRCIGRYFEILKGHHMHMCS